jgi:hypothetical protein
LARDEGVPGYADADCDLTQTRFDFAMPGFKPGIVVCG